MRAKRKRSRSTETFSDLLGPSKRGRSFQSVNDGSFELSEKAERLRYFHAATDAFFSPYNSQRDGAHPSGALSKSEMEHRICALEDELYGPPIGTESPRGMHILVSHFDTLLPGIRLKERLYALKDLSHQRIVDMLAIDGHLNARILNKLRMSEIESLDLTASLMDEEGLNLGARELLHVFEKPNSFLFVSELSLSGASLQDLDITSIHHLPRLARLWLSSTGIGNEAVFHLVALNRTLAELDLALNPRIDDDAILALLALPKLRFLSVFDTSVGMSGLRRFAIGLRERTLRKGFDIEVPRECEEYIENLHKMYMLHPQPPLVIDPAACTELSATALRRNLTEHAAFNRKVIVGGSQAEMAERLERILTVRDMDLAVRELVWKSSDKNGDAAQPKEETSDGNMEVF